MKKYKYKVNKNITAKQLKEYGFIRISKNEYYYRTSVYRYKKMPLVFMVFTINIEECPHITIDCETNNHIPFVPFYNDKYSNDNQVLKIIKNKEQIILNDMVNNKILIEKQ